VNQTASYGDRAYDEGPLGAYSAWRNRARPDPQLASIGFRVACDAE